MSVHLFSYGTLQPEQAPGEILHVVKQFQRVGPGFVRGKLYDLGSYPGAVLDPTTPTRIDGTVFRIPDDRSVIEELDRYEEYDPNSPATSLFVRRICPVHLPDGSVVNCWIYEYNGRVRAA
jgi:gamma-glutamylcyclotransferase (GGCT)/AIG2-like uncharacterized protein YtfP